MTNHRITSLRVGASACALAGFCLMFSFLATVPLEAQSGAENPAGPLDQLYRLKSNVTARISSADPTGGNRDWLTIGPGETKTLAEISGAGVLRRFYMAPLADDRMRYRKLTLRMYWDGETEPSVEVPLGDFFGSGLGTLRYFHSLVVDVNPGIRAGDFDGLVSYLPMPFAKKARVTLENDGRVSDFRVWYHIDYEKFADGGLPPDAGRLHAQWRREAHTTVPKESLKNTTLGNDKTPNLTGKDNFVILEAKGTGAYVGLFLTVDNLVGGWYGEGDDMIFIDGAQKPVYQGTGHEEVFNAGCCPDAEFWGAYTGFYLIENRDGRFRGKNQMYRFYVNDPIRFSKEIRVTIEHGHANNFENDYTSTAFWYQHEPHRPFPALPAAAERVPAWPAEVAEALDKELRFVQELNRLKAAKTPISPEHKARIELLQRERQKSFRELRGRDFAKAVEAFGAVLESYRRPGR
jgi:hypothetical protein